MNIWIIYFCLSLHLSINTKHFIKLFSMVPGLLVKSTTMPNIVYSACHNNNSKEPRKQLLTQNARNKATTSSLEITQARQAQVLDADYMNILRSYFYSFPLFLTSTNHFHIYFYFIHHHLLSSPHHLIWNHYLSSLIDLIKWVEMYSHYHYEYKYSPTNLSICTIL